MNNTLLAIICIVCFTVAIICGIAGMTFIEYEKEQSDARLQQRIDLSDSTLRPDEKNIGEKNE